MATKKKKKTTTKKAAKKKAAKKAAKKPAKKKAAKKKKKAPAKKTKAAKKKKAPKKKAAPKKAAAQKAAAQKAAEPKEAAQELADVPNDFGPALQLLRDLVNGGKVGEMDFEMYESFNEQYKPSDWTRNPAADVVLKTFGMDGRGGQCALWRVDAGADLDDCPVVWLGDDGDLKVLAGDLPSFLSMVAAGHGPAEVAYDMVEEPSESAELSAWLKEHHAGRNFAAPAEIAAAARAAHPGFEDAVRAMVPKD